MQTATARTIASASNMADIMAKYASPDKTPPSSSGSRTTSAALQLTPKEVTDLSERLRADDKYMSACRDLEQLTSGLTAKATDTCGSFKLNGSSSSTVTAPPATTAPKKFKLIVPTKRNIGGVADEPKKPPTNDVVDVPPTTTTKNRTSTTDENWNNLKNNIISLVDGPKLKRFSLYDELSFGSNETKAEKAATNKINDISFSPPDKLPEPTALPPPSLKPKFELKKKLSDKSAAAEEKSAVRGKDVPVASTSKLSLKQRSIFDSSVPEKSSTSVDATEKVRPKFEPKKKLSDVQPPIEDNSLSAELSPSSPSAHSSNETVLFEKSHIEKKSKFVLKKSSTAKSCVDDAVPEIGFQKASSLMQPEAKREEDPPPQTKAESGLCNAARAISDDWMDDDDDEDEFDRLTKMVHAKPKVPAAETAIEEKPKLAQPNEEKPSFVEIIEESDTEEVADTPKGFHGLSDFMATIAESSAIPSTVSKFKTKTLL